MGNTPLARRRPARRGASARSCTLPDSIGADLDLLSIGINPSLYSVERGYNFARPGNRFWPAFNASGLAQAPVEPGRAAIRLLRRRDRIGFTDIVKRPTRKADELTDEDYRSGARRLARKIARHAPRIAWFQGISAYARFLEHALGVTRRVVPGLQPERFGITRVYVTPNPSGANPAAAPKALLAQFRALARLRRRWTRGRKAAVT